MIARAEKTLGSGAPIVLETGKLAKQAAGSIVVSQGETMVLVAAAANDKPSTFDFFALTCDYRERTYAAGKIPGGYFKREARPTEHETLTARLIDRPIRPLFPKGFSHEVQIMCTVLSSDGEHDADILAILGASAALRVSALPFDDALGAVRVGCVDGEFIANPTHEQRELSTVDLVVAGTVHGITMMEAGMEDIPESTLLEAIAFGYEQLKLTIELQEDLASQAAKPTADCLLYTSDAADD